MPAVIIDKKIKGGVPCIAGTRIPVENIIFLIEKKKESPANIATKYYTQLSLDQIHSALEWFEAHKNKYERLAI